MTPQLPQGFKFECHHQDLDYDGGDGQEVVSRQPGGVRVPEPGRHQHSQECDTENARPALLEAEDQELGEFGPGTAGRGRSQEAAGAFVDPLLHGG
ncbi:hypothetical protein QF031_000370 [Pseudarthrobacter defluvii]|nr:hypothetical protein [Pseudarthrobacter defluvii]